MPTPTAEYDELETILIALLDAAIENVEVVAYPQANDFPGVIQAGLLIVGDAGDSLNDPDGRFMGGALAQSGTYSFNLDLYVKELRGPHGIRAVIKKIRDAVSGVAAGVAPSPLSMSRFVYRGSRPVQRSDAAKVWNYQVTVDANYKLFST